MKAVKKHELMTTFKNSRKVLMKLFFSAPLEEINKEDRQEVYLLYNLLEDLE